MNRGQTVRELLDEYNRGLITGAGLSSTLLEVLANTDVDAQLSGLSPDALDWVLWELRDNYAPIVGHDPASYGILEGVTVLPGAEEEYRLELARREERLRTIEIPTIQRWLRAHPLPAREPFPTTIVRGLHARIDHDRQILWMSKPPHLARKQWRAWAERERYDELSSLEIELKKSLQRAELAGAGSAEQALAWEGFDRVAHLLAHREDLTAEERGVVIGAQQRRREHVGGRRP